MDEYKIENRTLLFGSEELAITDLGIREAVYHQLSLAGAPVGTAKIAYAPPGMPSERHILQNPDGSGDYSWDLSQPTSALFTVRAEALYIQLAGVADATPVSVTAMGWRQ